MVHPENLERTKTMSKETTTASDKDDSRPHFTVKQYRYIRLEDGLKLRRETVGAGWNNNGSITLRLNGMQIIEGDLYLFPVDGKTPE
jgi:hypothetical protein